MDEGLGTRFWLKGAGLIIGFAVITVGGWLIFTDLIVQFGFIAAGLLLFGVLALFAHRYDKKKQRQYANEV